MNLKLMERDYLILREIDRWRFCLGRHIKKLAGFVGTRACDRRLKILIEAGYLDRKKILYGVPSVYSLTHKAKLLLGLNIRPDKFRIEQITHDTAVLDMAIYTMAKQDLTLENIVTEKQLHAESGFSKRKHFPDFVFLKDDKKYCVEVEIALKAKQRLEKIIETNFSDYYIQIWAVPNSAIKIRKILKENSITYPNIQMVNLEEVEKFVKSN